MQPAFISLLLSPSFTLSSEFLSHVHDSFPLYLIPCWTVAQAFWENTNSLYRLWPFGVFKLRRDTNSNSGVILSLVVPGREKELPLKQRLKRIIAYRNPQVSPQVNMTQKKNIQCGFCEIAILSAQCRKKKSTNGIMSLHKISTLLVHLYSACFRHYAKCEEEISWLKWIVNKPNGQKLCKSFMP